MGPDQKLIDEVIATFPKTFGLRNFPDETFRISPMHSYFTGPGYGEGRLMLYTERKREDGSWASFAKGTEYELRDNLVKAPSKNLTTDDLDIVATNMIAGGHENAYDSVIENHGGRAKVQQEYGSVEQHPEYDYYFRATLNGILADATKDALSYFPERLYERWRREGRWAALTESEMKRVQKRIEKREGIKLHP
jgi:hypothetical protein